VKYLSSYLKFPYPSKASFVTHSRYKLNTIGYEQRPCLTPPIFTCLVFTIQPIQELSPMYNLLISLLSCQPIPVLFRICMNLVQFTQSNALCQSMEQAHNSSSISKVHSDIIHSIPIAALVPFSCSEYKMIFSKYILYLPFKPSSKNPRYFLRCRCDEADCAMLAAFCSFWLLQSNHCNFNEILGPLSSFIYTADQLCH